MNFADCKSVFDLTLRASFVLIIASIITTLLWVGPIRNAAAQQQTETVPATIKFHSPSLCASPPLPLFASIADLIACMNQELDTDHNIWFRMTGNMTPAQPGYWCLEAIVYDHGIDQPPTGTNPCQESAVASGVCPDGYIDIWPPDGNQLHATCSITLYNNDQTQKPCPFCVGNPIFPGTGNKQQVDTDYRGPGPTSLTFSRTYNSRPQNGNPWWGNWHTNFEKYIVFSRNSMLVTRPDQQLHFTWNGTLWYPDADVNFTGVSPPCSMMTPDSTDVEYYGDNCGPILNLKTASGVVKQTYTYSTSSTPTTIAPGAG